MIDSRYQTFWRRFWAGNIDALVILPLAFIDPWKHSQQLPIFLLELWFIFHETAWYFYSVLMHGRYGQTLGKMVCKVKVVDKSEAKPITYRQAFFRDSPWNVVGLILSIMIYHDVARCLAGKRSISDKRSETSSLFFTLVID